MTITTGYSPMYLQWTGSHASPQRAAIAMSFLEARAADGQFELNQLDVGTSKYNRDRNAEDLALVHDPAYIARVRAGEDSGAPGEQGFIAEIMFAGTRRLVGQIDEEGFANAGLYFNPQGAKHHAAYDHSSGFCVFNDFAWAAQHFASRGLKVAYLDWDVHHGDGVQDLTIDNPSILTVSIHQRGIFPGTGLRSSVRLSALNYPLDAGAEDEEWLECVADAVEAIAQFAPDVLLVAAGADAHESDPLGGLNITLEGFREAASLVGQFARERQIPVLVGGAGGYQPFTFTPLVWAEVLDAMHGAMFGPASSEIMVWEEDPDVALDGLDYVRAETAEQAAWLEDPKEEIRARLNDIPILEWENVLTRQEFELMADEITPTILKEMERVSGATPGRTTTDRDRHATQGYKTKGRKSRTPKEPTVTKLRGNQ